MECFLLYTGGIWWYQTNVSYNILIDLIYVSYPSGPGLDNFATWRIHLQLIISAQCSLQEQVVATVNLGKTRRCLIFVLVVKLRQVHILCVVLRGHVHTLLDKLVIS